jgi:hypothetical protein
VNEPVDFCPKCSSRILSARCVSVPGSVKRFVRRSERPKAATRETPTTATQAATTAQRQRIILRVQRSIYGRRTALRAALRALIPGAARTAATQT